MTHRLPRLLLVALALGVFVVGFWRLIHRQEEPDPNEVVGSGTVEAEELDIAAESVGRITELLVEEGQRVAAGDIVAILQGETLAAELDRAEAAAYTARMRLADAENGVRPEEIRVRAARLDEAMAALSAAQRTAAVAADAYRRPTELAAAVDRATAELRGGEAGTRQARAQQEEAVAGPRAEEIAQSREALALAEAGIRAARAALDAAEVAARGASAELTEVRQATAARLAANPAVDAAESRLDAARAARAQAEARRELVNAPPRPDRREQLVRRVESARAELALAIEQAGRDKTLFDAGAIPEKQLEVTLTRQKQAAAAVEEATAALADLEAGARPQESAEVAAAVRQASAEVAGAEAQVANAQREKTAADATARQQLERAATAMAAAREQRNQAAANLAGAERRRDQASSQLDLLLAGTRRERIAASRAQVGAAEARQTGAAEALRHARQAKADRFALRQQLETAQGQVATAAARVASARAELDLALAGGTHEQIEMARGELNQAQAGRAAAESRLADTVIKSPRGGTVSRIILREGETVQPGAVVVRVLDLDQLWVRVYLPVIHFGRILLGQAASVTSDAYPDKVYPGSVLAVSDQAEFTPKNTQTTEERVKQVYWVKVGVGDGGGELKPGLPADVAFPGHEARP